MIWYWWKGVELHKEVDLVTIQGVLNSLGANCHFQPHFVPRRSGIVFHRLRVMFFRVEDQISRTAAPTCAGLVPHDSSCSIVKNIGPLKVCNLVQASA